MDHFYGVTVWLQDPRPSLIPADYYLEPSNQSALSHRNMSNTEASKLIRALFIAFLRVEVSI